MRTAREHELAGATVLRGLEGFGLDILMQQKEGNNAEVLILCTYAKIDDFNHRG